MRIGVFMPLRMGSATLPDATQITAFAQMMESVDLDGIWSLDMLGAAGGQPRPDPLIWLHTACMVTDHIELGTAVYNTAIRNPVDVAQRLMTLEMLVPGRFSIGVGAGSTEASDQSVGFEFDTRFQRFYENMDVVRRVLRGERVVDTVHGATGETFMNTPPGFRGPRFYLGAWHSMVSMRHVVEEYDGWLCSAGYRSHITGGRTDNGVGTSTMDNIREAMRRYVDLGGRGRKIMSTVSWDFSGAGGSLESEDRFNLVCPPEQAAERLAELAEIGFDDVLLSPANQMRADASLIGEDDLAQLRALVPKDTRPL